MRGSPYRYRSRLDRHLLTATVPKVGIAMNEVVVGTKVRGRNMLNRLNVAVLLVELHLRQVLFRERSRVRELCVCTKEAK